MGLHNKISQYRAWKSGVVHATLNPEGPGALRIHLVPPRFQLLGNSYHVAILNGYYILPIGYSWALLLRCFLEELEPHHGEPLDEEKMEAIFLTTVDRVHKTYYVTSRKQLISDLREILSVFFDIARNKEPDITVGQLSIREYASHMTAPHRMDLMISAMTNSRGRWNCNQKCLHCYAADQPNATVPELGTEEWKKVIDRCRKAGIPQLTFTGGEPTMREDLVDLVEYSRWFVTRLNTNGALMTPELAGRLAEASLDSVQFTLYSHDEEAHNRLVGAEDSPESGNFNRTVEGIGNALAAGLDISVNTPLCLDNRDYGKTLAFLQEKGVRYASCSGLIQTGRAAGAKSISLQLSEEELVEILRDGAAYCEENEMELSFTSPGWVSEDKLAALNLNIPACGACLSNMAIAPDGTVVPCQSWLSEGFSLGKMQEEKWETIWKNPTCTKIRGMDDMDALNCPFRSGQFQEAHQ